REVGAVLRLAEAGVKVFEAQRPLLGRRIFDAATNGPTGPRLGAGGEAGLVAGAVGDAAGAIEQEVVGCNGGARAQGTNPALLVAEVRQVEPVGADEIDAAAARLAFNAKYKRPVLEIDADLSAPQGAISRRGRGRRALQQRVGVGRKLIG